MTRRTRAVLALGLLFAVGASGALQVAQAQTWQTTATFYSPSLQGNLMACGGTYNRWDPTIAATNRYPCGTRLQVARGEAELDVVVRDTGSAGLTIDLSEAGFAQLGRLSEGRIPVVVTPVN